MGREEMMMEFSEHFGDHFEDGSRATLERIAAGGRHLTMIARRRIMEVLDALDEGDFRKASQALYDAGQVVTPLAHAQASIAVAGDADLVECRNLAVGMTIVDMGEITSLEVEECDGVMCEGHVKLTVGGHDFKWGAQNEVYVKRQTDEAE